MENINTFDERNYYRGFVPNENGQKIITINGTQTKGDWVEGYMFNKNIIIPGGQFIRCSKYDDKNILASDSCLEFYIVIPETVCQHTGKKNAFELDIIKHHFGDEIGVIRYGSYRNPFNDDQFAEHIGFYVDWIKGEDREALRKDLGYWLNITDTAGNIFENADLVKKDE